jgi:hypothetical protein
MLAGASRNGKCMGIVNVMWYWASNIRVNLEGRCDEFAANF